MKLYADEDVPSSMIAMLRSGGAKVLTTQEAGNTGRDDLHQVRFAAHRGLMLVTRNVKHLLDDQRVPFHATLGVIGLDLGNGSEDSRLTVQAIITELLVPYAELYENMKIRVSRAGATFPLYRQRGYAKNRWSEPRRASGRALPDG